MLKICTTRLGTDHSYKSLVEIAPVVRTRCDGWTNGWTDDGEVIPMSPLHCSRCHKNEIFE